MIHLGCYIFGKLTLALLYVTLVPVMILYLVYVGSKWLGGSLMSLETSWIYVSGREDVLPVFISPLKLCIVLIDLEFM